MVRRVISTRPTFAARESSTLLCSTLVHIYPGSAPSLVFQEHGRETESKPFVYIFINLQLIDLRTTVSSLLETLASSEYPRISRRLAASYDLVSAFIGHLVQSVDDEAESEVTLAPDLLLKLRRDIAETMSLTIEYLRDRWDSAVTGAAGLHADARHAYPAHDAPLALTWDSPNGGVARDGLTLASVRALALWLREDETASLRLEGAGIMEVLLGGYGLGGEEDHSFRSAVLTALEGLLTTDEGVDAFLRERGWATLWTDLETMLTTPLPTSTRRGPTPSTRLSIDIIRVLLVVVEYSPLTEGSARGTSEEWMDVVTCASSLSSASDPSSLARKGRESVVRQEEEEEKEEQEVEMSLYLLAVELLTRAPAGIRKRYAPEAAQIAGRARRFLLRYRPHHDHDLGHDQGDGDVDLVQSAREVALGLEALGYGSGLVRL